MDFVLCIDNNYVYQCCVLITSVMLTNRKHTCNFHILSEGLTSENQKKLLCEIEGKNADIKFYVIRDEVLSRVTIHNERFTPATYYRLFIPELLPQSIHKVLYLDCDMLVLDSLDELWNLDVTNYSAGVVISTHHDDIRVLNRLEIKPEYGYFNAGLLLINLDYWRTARIAEKAFDCLLRYPERCTWHDQDALNIVLSGTTLTVSAKYNVQLSFYHPIETLFISSLFHDDILAARENPIIVHFIGHNKPWFAEYRGPLKNVWLYFQRHTRSWPNRKPDHKYHGIKFFKHVLRHFMVAVHLRSPRNGRWIPSFTYEAQIIKRLDSMIN
jgi:lipopolysaccharide biosynthesis glycosyltransferase